MDEEEQQFSDSESAKAEAEIETDIIIDQMKESDEKNSMLYWWPKVKDLPGIKSPETVIVEIPHEVLRLWVRQEVGGAEKIESYVGALEEADRRMGRPLFLRSDQSSSKHRWDTTCFLDKGEDLMRHIYSILEEHEMAMFGPGYDAIVFREYIPMASKFTAFYHNFPVGKERRYFVEDGKVICHHAYWPEDSMRNPIIEKGKNWKYVLQALNFEADSEIRYLTLQAEVIASRFKGPWSIDFCMAKTGNWIFIDMALARDSWHPPECAHAKDWKRLYG